MLLLAFQKSITWRWQNLFEFKVSCKVKGYVADIEFGSMTFDKLWTLDNTLLIFNISCMLLITLIAF